MDGKTVSEMACNVSSEVLNITTQQNSTVITAM